MSTETITYRVDGMTCDHCTAAVNDEVAKVAGVESVAVRMHEEVAA
jgi:copper chaperone CopZ